jgi:hypothetical protein
MIRFWIIGTAILKYSDCHDRRQESPGVPSDALAVVAPFVIVLLGVDRDAVEGVKTCARWRVKSAT